MAIRQLDGRRSTHEVVSKFRVMLIVSSFLWQQLEDEEEEEEGSRLGEEEGERASCG